MNSERLTVAEVRKLVADPARASQVVESLLLTMSSDDIELCAWASDALQGIHQLSSNDARSVIPFCMHESAPVAAWACNLIGKTSMPDGHLQEAVAQALAEHLEVGVRQQAVLALEKMSALTPDTLVKLRVAADSDDPRLRRIASRVLHRQGAA